MAINYGCYAKIAENGKLLQKKDDEKKSPKTSVKWPFESSLVIALDHSSKKKRSNGLRFE